MPKYQKRISNFSKEIQNLIQKGRDQKIITEQELMKVVPNVEKNLLLLDDLYELFLDLGVDVVDVREEKIWKERLKRKEDRFHASEPVFLALRRCLLLNPSPPRGGGRRPARADLLAG